MSIGSSDKHTIKLPRLSATGLKKRNQINLNRVNDVFENLNRVLDSGDTDALKALFRQDAWLRDFLTRLTHAFVGFSYPSWQRPDSQIHHRQLQDVTSTQYLAAEEWRIHATDRGARASGGCGMGGDHDRLRDRYW